MTWSDPDTTHNPTTGAVIPTSWGDMVNQNLLHLYSLLVGNRPYCIATRAPATAIAAGYSDLVLTGVVADSMGGWNAANPTRIRLTEPGWYTVFVPLMFEPTAVEIQVRLRDLGTPKEYGIEKVNFGTAMTSGSNIYTRVYSDGGVRLTVSIWTSAAGATLYQDSIWGAVWEHK